MIQRLCIIGVGLIGGSLARALKAAGAVGEVVGYGRDAAQLQLALELGVIDRAETDLAAALSGSDVVVLAIPVGAMESMLCAMAQHLGADTIVTDVGSTKGSVVAAAERAFGAVPPRFVPGHPIAGTERSGVAASFAELYHKRRVILTPLPQTDPAAVAVVRALWQAAGAEVVEMTVRHHDEVLAATSHLPHVLAYTLVDTLARMEEHTEIFRFAAGGFRDFTRIASSDPRMWHDICLANREAILKVLDRYAADLAAVRGAIERGDGAALLHTFGRAKKARDEFKQ
ncbi:prephenate dehydrogenase/arogenate dehydrogenase family protein [Sulfurivermis fontis]|uniref:prephenate dehydrogenase/arogenate dehydrogenase family protein n=1 Tax=Sulfurivermis fontis TaxID=1972068 RepID=UPI000FD99AD4|nr:prephenate dehydrogenase/arogenate dehydrogenase family protein [Sulfurivermis fontis]